MKKIEEDSQKPEKDNLITLYPFNGRSPYLIDKFYIIGYNYLTLEKSLIKNIPKEIQKEKEKDLKEPHWYYFTLEEDPIILNEITNDYDKECLDDKSLLQMIFPHKVKCAYTWEENNNSVTKNSLPNNTLNKNDDDNNNFSKIEFRHSKLNEPSSYKVVFSSNPQSDNNSKKSINGIANVFYRRFLKKKVFDKKRSIIYYVPYTFCIISEYPYFSSFNKLITLTKKFYSQESIYIPIEILIYNIVNLSPSPLNSDILLDIYSSCFQEVKFGPLKGELIDSQNQDNKPKKDNKKINIQEEKKPNIMIRTITSKLDLKEEKMKNIRKNFFQKKNDIETFRIPFKYLSGYPLIQYNLPKVLFSNIFIENIITIFLYMFLEKDVIFFSKDIEDLTLTINAFLNLHFPLNDEKYFFIGCAISLEDFVNDKSKFGLKAYASVIGINDPFSEDYRNKVKLNDHLVVDLDNKEIYFGEALDDDNAKLINEKNKKLVKLIEKMCKETYDEEKPTPITLYQAIKDLYKRLKSIYDKVVIHQIKQLPGDLFDFNDTIFSHNKEIQESFYQFIQYICLYFYENLTIKSTQDGDKNLKKNAKEPEMNVIFNEDYNLNDVYNEEELIFLKELRTTMKYQSFVLEFLQSYNPIDLYKIPLTFTEEFLSIISRKKRKIKTSYSYIKFFDLIDSLYSKRKIADQKEINFTTINFTYFRNHKKRFDREIYDREKRKFKNDDTNLVKFIPNDKSTLIYQTFELDDNILLSYTHFIKNLSIKESLKMFPTSFFVYENTLNKIDVTHIESWVEDYCIKQNILSKSDICCANILLIFTIALKSLRETIDCQGFLSQLFQKFTIFRKYFSILLKMIYKLCQISIKENKLNQIENKAMCYYQSINSIRTQKIVPNEDLMKILIKFDKLDLDELSHIKEEKKENIENNIKIEAPQEMELYGEKLEEEEISEQNLYMFNNFSYKRFYLEKEVVEYVNKTNQSEVFTKHGTVNPMIRFDNGIHKIESFVLSQREILYSLIKNYESYLETLDDSKMSSMVILDSCLNIFIYMRNNEEFEGMDDIFDILKIIFYTFMNQLLIMKLNKEKSFNEKNL